MHNRRGVFLIMAGAACIVANDALIKVASDAMPLSQLMFVRGVCATAFLLLLAFVTRVPIRVTSLTHSRVLLRTGLEVVATFTYVTGLVSLQLANVTAIAMVTPVIVTLLAVLVLGENVSAGRWLAIAVGFAGVLLIVQPAGNEFNEWSLLILVSSFFIAWRDLLTRTLSSRDFPSLVLTLITAAIVTLCTLAWGTLDDWRRVDLGQIAALAAAGLFLASGFFLTTAALRQGEISLISPFRYSGLIFAAVLSYAVWNYVPNAMAVCGMILTLFAGMYLVRRA
jgi:drug/metabolite transporter (DMT)-like permease